jgi:uncharacterized membrane protein
MPYFLYLHPHIFLVSFLYAASLVPKLSSQSKTNVQIAQHTYGRNPREKVEGVGGHTHREFGAKNMKLGNIASC